MIIRRLPVHNDTVFKSVQKYFQGTGYKYGRQEISYKITRQIKLLVSCYIELNVNTVFKNTLSIFTENLF